MDSSESYYSLGDVYSTDTSLWSKDESSRTSFEDVDESEGIRKSNTNADEVPPLHEHYSRCGDNWSQCYCREGGTKLVKGMLRKTSHTVYNFKKREHPILSWNNYLRERKRQGHISEEELKIINKIDKENLQNNTMSQEMDYYIFNSST